MSEEITPLRLVAELRSPGGVAHDGVSQQLVELLPQTELAAAWAKLREIEERTGEVGAEALRCWPWLPRVELVAPLPPRHPVTEADLELAARLLSPAVVVTDRIRRRLADHLARSPLGPAVWQIREIEWTMAAPAIAEEPPVGIAALDVWRFVGELVDELLEQPQPEQAAVEDEGYHDSLVVHQLLHRQRALLFRDTRRCRDLARLAVVVGEETMRDAGTEWRHYGGLVALALAALANAHRILGDTASASKCLGRAEPYIRGETDAVMRWEYFHLVAIVSAHLRRIEEARAALARAIGLSRELGDGHRLAKALALRSYVDLVEGQLSIETVHRLKKAARLADPARETNFRQITELNIVAALVDLDLIEQAETTWKEIPPLGDFMLELRRRGLLGAIHLGARRWALACRELAVCIEGMVAANHIDAAYFQLLHGLALFGAGRYREAVEESSTAARYYATAGIHSVALAAKQVVSEASSGNLNVQRVAHLVKVLKLRPHNHAGPQSSRLPTGVDHQPNL